MSPETSKYISTAFIVVIIALIFNFTVENKSKNLALVRNTIAKSQIETPKKVFPNVSLEARAAVVYDFAINKYLFELNGDSQLPLASITKLMTVYTALKNAPRDLEVRIDSKSLSTLGDFGLTLDDHWDLDEISKYTLVNSANDGAEAISTSVGKYLNKNFVELMTQTAKEIGLTQTYYINPTGLDESSNLPSGFGSAKDMATLAIFAYNDYKTIFSATTLNEYTATSKQGKTLTAINTNQESLNISGLRLSKTGYTDIAGGNLAIVMEIEPKRPIAIVVLGSSKEGRFNDVNNLAKATIDFMTEE